MTVSIEQHLRNRVAYYCDVVREKFPNLIFHNPSVQFFDNSRTSGRASESRNIVYFNRTLAQENVDVFDNTVMHEIAHIVAPKVFAAKKIKPHGREFKHVFMQIGGNGKRCHNYDVSNIEVRRQDRYGYTCSCNKIFLLSATRHNRIKKGIVYRCVTCNTKLMPKAA